MLDRFGESTVRQEKPAGPALPRASSRPEVPIVGRVAAAPSAHLQRDAELLEVRSQTIVHRHLQLATLT